MVMIHVCFRARHLHRVCSTLFVLKLFSSSSCSIYCAFFGVCIFRSLEVNGEISVAFPFPFPFIHACIQSANEMCMFTVGSFEKIKNLKLELEPVNPQFTWNYG